MPTDANGSKPVANATRVGAAAVDALVSGLSVWVVITVFGVPAPRFAFMQSYSDSEQSGYFQLALATMALMFAYSTLACALPSRGTLGKCMSGLTVRCADGSAPDLGRILVRNLIIYGLLALVFLPGPIAAATLGEDSEGMSATLLFFALIIVPVVLLEPIGRATRPLHQQISGVWTVRR